MIIVSGPDNVGGNNEMYLLSPPLSYIIRLYTHNPGLEHWKEIRTTCPGFFFLYLYLATLHAGDPV